ncbi:NudC domain-containing protein 1 [Termitomyces sp. T112]|nr:hypothetical protein C0989_012164 [Termitomyces sp. Mn162]KAG5732727.1 NudC domain-containing protein 1 [Termitomyces sp. T112]KAH0586280.1 hypothetical protein H2248_007527 [Termitomyces sp. 'cryptogamus']KNZ80981.1 NudC domain-containing protein 1 [Termitomyces sp. J132]
MTLFESTRTLINPKFEGYKLDPVSQDEIVARYPLQFKPTQATVSGKSPLSFQEVQSRITHNHLAICIGANRAMYVDSAHRVILIDIDPATISPSFRVLYELSTSVQSDDTNSPHHEYASGAFITPSIIVVSDGQGLLYTLNVINGDRSEALGIFSLPSPGLPFRIHTAHRLSPTVVFVILSSRYYSRSGKESKGWKKPSPTIFDIWGVKIDLTSFPLSGVQQMEVLWHRRGPDIPIYAVFMESLKASLLIGGTTYQQVGYVSTPVYEPSLDEIAPIPRVDEEKFDVDAPEPAKPPPYSWTQTSDSVTVAIPLPSSTPKSTIKVIFTPQTLTVHVDNEVSSSVPIPRYSMKNLWDGISASTSYWTWDREAEHSFGLLTLHIDKQHEGTRWTQLFASAGDFEDVEVLETLDPSELWHVREALEKYTAALRDGDDASGLGLGRGVPSLAEGELDMEVDEIVGRKAFLSWVGEKGGVPQWWKNVEEIAFQLLSVPIPGFGDTDVSLIVKNNLDGTVHTLDSRNPNSPVWTHTSTFPALSFVLASKQDTRFTFHSSNDVFAFEGGLRDRGGNVYIYRVPPSNAKWAKQAILKVGDGYGGSLLGVGMLHVGGSIPMLLCLAEGELILLKNP